MLMNPLMMMLPQMFQVASMKEPVPEKSQEQRALPERSQIGSSVQDTSHMQVAAIMFLLSRVIGIMVWLEQPDNSCLHKCLPMRSGLFFVKVHRVKTYLEKHLLATHAGHCRYGQTVHVSFNLPGVALPGNSCLVSS